MIDEELEYVELLKEAPVKLMVNAWNISSTHWHSEYEMLFVLRGCISVRCERGEYDMKAGDLLMIGTREIHSTHRMEKDSLCLMLQFSPQIITEVYHSEFEFFLNTMDTEEPVSIGTKKEIQKILAGMCLSLYDKPDGYQFAIKSGLYAFVSALFSNVRYRRIDPKDLMYNTQHLKDLDQIKKYIKGHFKEEIKAEDLAHDLGMSRAKLYQVLKHANSGSIKNLTNYYRVDHAKHLLKNTDLTIQFIADESGFESDSSFFRVFKSQTGMAPNEFRNAPAEKTEKVGVQSYQRYAGTDAICLLQEFYEGEHPSQKEER